MEENKGYKMKTIKNLLLVGVAVSAMSCSVAQAATYGVTDLNSSASINTDTGMTSWVVDGDDILFRQWFWYRIGNQMANTSISSLELDAGFGAGRTAGTTFAGDGFAIDIIYTLTGGTPGSGWSDIAETIRIVNTGRTALDFHLIQYSDFDLSGNLADLGNHPNANTIQQYGSQGSLSETVVTPPASRWEIDNWATLLNQIEGGAYNLSSTQDANNSDIAWAFQWDVTLQAGGTLIISKDKNYRPVPDAGATVAMLGLAMASLAMMRRRFVR